VQYFNRRYARSGTLWESRYRSCLVDSADYVLACYRYIELNPVRAGMVGSAAEYPWSSHLGNTGRILNELLTSHTEYAALGSDMATRHASYRQLFVREDEAGFLAAVRDATNGGFALVGDSLKARIEAETGRHLDRRRSGPSRRADSPGIDDSSEELGLCPRTTRL
jgi:putative transposase